MRTPRIAAVAASAILAAALAACSGSAPTGSADSPLSPQAYAAATPPEGTEVWVRGMLLESGSVAHLCDGLLESYPPQCVSEVGVTGLAGSWWEDEAEGVR
ncbi:MAG: hypothetical protein Q4G64_09205, partial [bacterium]|nr:hypothetical protein [bacterium]